jgi:hypothetical protein
MPCGFHQLNLENSYTAPAEVVPNVQDERLHMWSTVLHTAEAIFVVILSLRWWMGLEFRGMGEEKMRRLGRV